jgi:polysaccharide pyruvyl transferase WcaK-like protein
VHRTGRPGGVKIGVFGHYGTGNLGDEAITTAVIQNIRLHLPSARICCFSINPDDTESRYQIPAFPVRQGVRRSCGRLKLNHKTNSDSPRHECGERATFGNQRCAKRLKNALKTIPFVYSTLKTSQSLLQLPLRALAEIKFLWDSYLVLRDIDLLLVSGSNQFLDNYGGTGGFPYTLFKWSVLAKLARAKLAFASVGAGPLDSNLSKMLVRASVLLSDYTSFRDQASKEIVVTAFLRNKGSVFPDLAHSLSTEHRSALEETSEPADERPKIGINPMPVYYRGYWYIADETKYFEYVGMVAAFSSVLIREGYPLFFFSTMPKDENVIEDIVAALDEDAKQKVKRENLVKPCRSVSELIQRISRADIVVATRFHGTLLPLAAGKPVLGICYHRKSSDLLKEYAQERYSVDLDHLQVEDLLKRFRELEINSPALQMTIHKKNDEHRDALARQYETLFNLLTLSPRNTEEFMSPSQRAPRRSFW